MSEMKGRKQKVARPSGVYVADGSIDVVGKGYVDKDAEDMRYQALVDDVEASLKMLSRAIKFCKKYEDEE